MKRDYVFLFKENGTDDRDCVRYIDLETKEYRTNIVNKNESK